MSLLDEQNRRLYLAARERDRLLAVLVAIAKLGPESDDYCAWCYHPYGVKTPHGGGTCPVLLAQEALKTVPNEGDDT